MGEMGCGYGSEFHLLRYLGYHRRDLNHAIEQETGGRVLDWLDFCFDSRRKFPDLDAEWQGLDFLGPDSEGVKTAWEGFWPQTGNVPNWDAVGLLQLQSRTEFILVEAKAHLEEVRSECGAHEGGGLPMIRKAFAETIAAHRFKADPDEWLKPYYQYANRLATLHYLTQHNVLSRLACVYFTGDDATRYKGHVLCPQNEQEWNACLHEMDRRLGITGSSELEQRVHRVFLPVGGQASEGPDE
jgi:hypothetical protein